MKCDNCGKRDATVHLTEIRENTKVEMPLCEKCAALKGLHGNFPLTDLLAGIAAGTHAAVKGTYSKKALETSCPVCGITLAEFQASGRFGCAEDYTAFKDEVMPLIEKIHDASQHVGKSPSKAGADVSLQKEIYRLQAELKKAVRKEEYERAAEIRDMIKQIEEKAAGNSDASTTEK